MRGPPQTGGCHPGGGGLYPGTDHGAEPAEPPVALLESSDPGAPVAETPASADAPAGAPGDDAQGAPDRGRPHAGQ